MARYRIVITPAAGSPGFLMQRKRSRNLFRPHDGAVLERPDNFEPFETLDRTAADNFARIAENNVCAAHVMKWEA